VLSEKLQGAGRGLLGRAGWVLGLAGLILRPSHRYDPDNFSFCVVGQPSISVQWGRVRKSSPGTRSISMSVLVVTTICLLALFAGSALAVVVLCLRAPLRNDLDDDGMGRLTSAERHGKREAKQSELTTSQKKELGGSYRTANPTAGRRTRSNRADRPRAKGNCLKSWTAGWQLMDTIEAPTRGRGNDHLKGAL
jgi:hypothetical protein